MTAFSVGSVILAHTAFPSNAFEATAEDAWSFVPSPAAVRMWLVVCAVALGCLLMLVAVRPPRLHPGRRSLSLLAAGVLVVALAGTLVGTVLYPRVSHTVADGPGEPAPVPTTVTRVGWSWGPPMGTEVEEVRAGTHGPLVLFTDGAVALDGATGEELWSYRRPLTGEELRSYARPPAEARDVWADGRNVYVRHVPESSSDSGREDPATVVLDAVTGEVTEEDSDVLAPAEVLPEQRDHRAEDLWSRALGHDPNCAYGEPERIEGRVVGLLGCVDGRYAEDGDGFRDLFRDDGFEVRVSAVAVDPATEEELWRRGWTVESSGDIPDIFQSPVARGEPLAVVDPGGGDVPFGLDPATGEETVTFPEEWVRAEEDGRSTSLVRADGEGVVFAEQTGDAELVVHRAAPSGEIADSTVVEGVEPATIGFHTAAVLDDVLLLPVTQNEQNPETARSELVVVPFGGGEAVSGDPAPRISSAGHPIVDVVAVPGAVVVAAGDSDTLTRIEGLVA